MGGAIAMLTAPENGEEWAEEIWAKSLEEARTLCQKMAGHELTEVINVTQKTQKPSKNKNYKFICWFKTENLP
jgi:gas vesicle protein